VFLCACVCCCCCACVFVIANRFYRFPPPQSHHSYSTGKKRHNKNIIHSSESILGIVCYTILLCEWLFLRHFEIPKYLLLSGCTDLYICWSTGGGRWVGGDGGRRYIVWLLLFLYPHIRKCVRMYLTFLLKRIAFSRTNTHTMSLSIYKLFVVVLGTKHALFYFFVLSV